VNIGNIFLEEPVRWGLRGDPYLWEEFKCYFKNVSFPESSEVLLEQLEEAFLKLTGHTVKHDEYIFIKRYDKGGMSSGHVSPQFWEEKAFPFLIAKYKEAA